MDNLELSLGERCEVNAILEGGINRQNVDNDQRISLLDIEIEHYKKLSDESKKDARKKFFKSIARVAQLEEDNIRMKMGLLPESDVANEILNEEIETNDLSRFERFKEFVKRNFGGLAGIIIGIGGIVTSVVVGVRSAVKTVEKTLGDFSKGVAGVVKNVGPLIGSVLGLVSSILGASAKTITWLSKNLWLLVVMLIVYLFERYSKKEKN